MCFFYVFGRCALISEFQTYLVGFVLFCKMFLQILTKVSELAGEFLIYVVDATDFGKFGFGPMQQILVEPMVVCTDCKQLSFAIDMAPVGNNQGTVVKILTRSETEKPLRVAFSSSQRHQF